MGAKNSFSPSNRTFAGQTDRFTSINPSWAMPGGPRPLSPFERAARFTGLTLLAIATLFCIWLLTAWLMHGLVRSFDPVPVSGVIPRAVAAGAPGALISVKAPAGGTDSRLLRAVRADLDEAVRGGNYERVTLPELGEQGACVVWHEEIGQLGMILRVAGPAEGHGIPINSPDLINDVRGQLD